MKVLVFEFICRIMYSSCLLALLYCFSYLNQGLQHDYFSGIFSSHYQAVDFNSYENARCELVRILECDVENKYRTVCEHDHSSHSSYEVKKKSSYRDWEDVESEVRSPNFEFEKKRPFLFLVANTQAFFDPELFRPGAFFELDEIIVNDKDNSNLKYYINAREQYKQSFIDVANQNESKSWSYMFMSSLTYFYCLSFKIVYVCEFSVRNVLSYILLFFCIQLNAHITPGLLKKHRNMLRRGIEHVMIIILLPLLNNQNFFFGHINIEDELMLELLDSELQIDRAEEKKRNLF